MQKILSKLNAIMSEVDYIQKDKANTHFGYKYASEQTIKEALHPLFVKYKVILMIETLNPRREVYTSARGGRAAITDIDIKYTFYDTESGESMGGVFNGTGDDGADKGTYKAITGAIKYILTSTFLIPTGDDPEEDSNLASNASQGGQTSDYAPRPIKTSPQPVLTPNSPSTVPFTNTKKVEGEPCPQCGLGKIVKSLTKGNLYCSEKCWLK